MPQSLSKVYVHLIFSTKNRERTLRDEVRPDLHAYIGGILRDLDISLLHGDGVLRQLPADFSGADIELNEVGFLDVGQEL